MTRLKSYLLFILLISLMNNCFCIRKTELLNILKKFDPRIKKTFNRIPALTEFFHSNEVDTSEESVRPIDKTNKILSDILLELLPLSSQTPRTRLHIDERLNFIINAIPEHMRTHPKVFNNVETLKDKINHIDDLYDTRLARVFEKSDDVGARKDLIEIVLRGTHDISRSINDIYRVIIPETTFASAAGFLSTLVDKLKLIDDRRCNYNVSAHIWLYEVYIKTLTTEVKGYVLNMIAYSIKSELSKVSYNFTMHNLTRDFAKRVGEYAAEMHPKLASLPRVMKRCDPENHIQGKTFTEVALRYQPFIVNEDQFSLGNTCNSCQSIGRVSGFDVFRRDTSMYNYVDGKCKGLVQRCSYQNVLLKPGSKICALPEGGNKRYEWLMPPGGNSDEPRNCSGKIQEIRPHFIKVKDGWFTSEWMTCPFCLCHCQNDPHRTLYAINLIPTFTDIDNNMVLVGLRLEEIDHILHLRVKQGKMLPGGKIDPSSVSWKTPIETNYDQFEKVIVTGGKSKKEKLIEWVDYISTWDRLLYFVLDETIADKNSIICGIRFVVVRLFQIEGIKVQVATASFNWATGQVSKNCQWVSSDLSEPLKKARQSGTTQGVLQSMTDLDDSRKAPSNNIILENKIIHLSTTSMYKDVGQTMVPLFDILPIETKPALPVGGIKFHHKSAPGFGGFISPMIFNLNMTDYISN